MYVGDCTTGTILVIENEMIMHTFNGCNGSLFGLISILFDSCSIMATSCTNNQLYLYYQNWTYIGKNIATPGNPRYIGYDSNGQFVQISFNHISIYN